MRIRLLKTVIDGSGEKKPGVVCDFDDKEARRLIRLRAAEEYIPPSTPSDDEVSEDGYTEEELRGMAGALCEINGVDDDIAYRLIEVGIVDVEAVANAELEDLIKIKGIGKRSVSKIQESAEDLVDSGSDA